MNFYSRKEVSNDDDKRRRSIAHPKCHVQF